MCPHVHEFLKKHIFSSWLHWTDLKEFKNNCNLYCVKSAKVHKTQSQLVAAGFLERAGNASLSCVMGLCWSSGLSGFIPCGSSLRSVWSKHAVICIDLLSSVPVQLVILPSSSFSSILLSPRLLFVPPSPAAKEKPTRECGRQHSVWAIWFPCWNLTCHVGPWIRSEELVRALYMVCLYDSF